MQGPHRPVDEDWNREAPHHNQPDYHFADRTLPFGYYYGSSYGAYYENSMNPDRSSLRGDRHRGKGPKNFIRNDNRIRDNVCNVLTRDSDIDASDIEVEVQHGEVTLSGTVPDRRMKRLAEDCAAKCLGVQDVHNRLRVTREGAADQARFRK